VDSVTIAWIEMAADAIQAAKERLPIWDYESRCRLFVPQPEKTLNDRLRVTEWLLSTGLLRKDDAKLAIASSEVPIWLRPHLLSGFSEAWAILDCIGGRHQKIAKYEVGLLAEIGLAGELAVMERLREVLPESSYRRVVHTSLTDDTSGYDISVPMLHQCAPNMLLEVKTSARPGEKFTFHISRNEVLVGARSSTWFLVAVRMKGQEMEILGHVPFELIEDLLPLDSSDLAQWQSCRIELPASFFHIGLPLDLEAQDQDGPWRE